MRMGALLALALLTGCGAPISSCPCPMVTEFPKPLQTQAASEMEGRPAITEMMNAMARDRAFNRVVCQ
jgi:hypothetical protein